MSKINIIVSIFWVLFSFQAVAQNSDAPFQAKFLVEGGIEYGGDEILKVFFTNGGDQTMKAGQGGYLAVGGQFQVAKISRLMLRTTIGIKYNTTAADNANIRLTRIPINVLAYGQITEDIRLGIGATSHQNVRFKGDSFVSDIDFTSSIGPRFEIGYKSVALTYTILNYLDEAEMKASANSIGLSLSVLLPNK